MLLAALSLLAATAFAVLFDYLFNRYMGREDTSYLASAMHAINESDTPAEPVKAKQAVA